MKKLIIKIFNSTNDKKIKHELIKINLSNLKFRPCVILKKIYSQNYFSFNYMSTR
jgi:hypothetical protein